MKTKYLILIGLLPVLAVVLSGCASGLTASGWPGVAADTNNAYISGGAYVYAVNLKDGTQAWRFPDKASANPFEAAPVLTSDGQLIVGGYDKKLYGINLQTHQSTWQFTGARDRWIGSVLVDNNMIYAPNADYNLYALNLQGQLQWTFAADQAIWGAPVSDGTNIYFGTLGRRVYAVNAKTGKEIWMQEVDGAVLGSPVLGGDSKLYVGSYGGTIYAMDTANGSAQTVAKTSSAGKDRWIWSGPALDGTTIYFGDGNGSLYAQPLSGTGQPWTQQLSGAITGTPAVSAGTIVVGTESSNVYFVDPSGKNPRAVPVSGKVYSSPVVAGDLFLVAPQGGDTILQAFDQQGTVKWSFIPPK